jgi:predicted N-formylglutamate amidohydrolase
LTPVDRSIQPTALLGADDPAPYAVLNEAGRALALVVCDHASRAIPKSLNRLGLPELATWQHVAWDIGAGELARGLATMLDAPAVLAGYSRLVVDCNRHPDNPDAFRRLSDGWEIPGNATLDTDARGRRLAACFDPYHECIAALLADLVRRGGAPLVVSVHTFTPVLGERLRPWHVGVLWDRDEGSARRVLAGLRRHPGLVVGDNEPYSGKHPSDFTIDHHAGRAGLPHVCLEVRQDQFESAAGTERWVRILGSILREIIAERAAASAGELR